MALDTVKYIKQKVNEYDSEIDTSSSSALIDLMVNPINSIVNPLYTSIVVGLNQLSIQDRTSMDEDSMDARAADFFVERNKGGKAQGYVRIYFNSPRSLAITKDTEFFTADGKVYIADRNYQITKNTMLTNIDRYPLYDTGNIPVTAETEGDQYDIEANQITKVTGLNTSYQAVANPLPITGGSSKETNEELYTKIINSIENKSLMSDKGIKTQLMETFSTINSIKIKGMGDDEMQRDLVYSGQMLSNILYSNYFGAVSGYHAPPYNQSVAYYNYFSNNTVSGLDLSYLPDIEDLVFDGFEFTNNMYLNLFKNDANKTEISVEIIFSDTFTSSATLSNGWVLSDGKKSLTGLVGSPNLSHPDEISYDSNRRMVKLGRIGNQSTNGSIVLPVSEVEQMFQLFQEAIVTPILPYEPIPEPGDYYTIIEPNDNQGQ